MVNNQEEFSNKYSNKEIKEIELRRKKFEGQLVIEGYSSLEKLSLRDVINIDKITLKNLPELQECTIWGCGLKDLVMEDCPQIRKLNVRKNFLTNLEFLENLEKLEELEVDGNAKIDSGLKYLPLSLEKFSYENTELTELLKPDWEIYKKERQELFEEVKQNPQRLAKNFWDLSKRHEKTKSRVSFLLSKENQQKTTSQPINTKELVSNLEKEFKDKEVRINELETELNSLKANLVKEKEGQLDKLKDDFVEKKINFLDSNKKKKKEKARDNLKIYLDSVKRQDVEESKFVGEKAKEWLLKGEKKDSELTKLLDKICGIQKEITSKEIREKRIIEKLKEEHRKKEESLQREIDRIEKLIHSGEGNEPDSKLLKELKNEFWSLQTKVIIRKTENYLEAKKNYLDLRLEIAKGLQKCCDELNKHNNIEIPEKKAVIEGVSNILEVITVTVPTKVVNVSINFSKLAKAFSTIVDYRGVIFTEECEKEFQKYLENNENVVNSFKENYGLLRKILEENKNLPISSKIIEDLELEDTKGSTKPLKTFEIRHEEVCGISENWKEKYLKLEKMEEKVKSVVENLSKFNSKLNIEKNRLENIKEERQLQSCQEIPPKNNNLKDEKESEKLFQQSFAEQLERIKDNLENSLGRLKNDLKEKLGRDLGILLDTLLEIRVNIIEKGNDSLAEEKFESLASLLREKINEKFGKETEKVEKELERLHQVQKEIVYFKIIHPEFTQWEAKIEIPISNK